MFGIVLWRDGTQKKAVIWCEDQGDLAYMDARDDASGFEQIEAGDMVEFDVAADDTLRLASNLRSIQQSAHPHIADYLKELSAVHEPTPLSDGGGNVIPFKPRAALTRQPLTASG